MTRYEATKDLVPCLLIRNREIQTRERVWARAMGILLGTPKELKVLNRAYGVCGNHSHLIASKRSEERRVGKEC